MMMFQTDRMTMLAAGLILAAIGASQLAFGILAADQVPFLIVLGVVLLVDAAGLLQFRRVVRVHQERRLVERATPRLWFTQRQRWSVSQFRGVGLGITAARSSGGWCQVSMPPQRASRTIPCSAPPSHRSPVRRRQGQLLVRLRLRHGLHAGGKPREHVDGVQPLEFDGSAHGNFLQAGHVGEESAQTSPSSTLTGTGASG